LCPFWRRVFALAAGDNLEHGIWQRSLERRRFIPWRARPYVAFLLRIRLARPKKRPQLGGKPEAVLEILMYRGATRTISSFIEEGSMLGMALEQQTRLRKDIEISVAVQGGTFRLSLAKAIQHDRRSTRKRPEAD
jgi:hypothetical protein